MRLWDVSVTRGWGDREAFITLGVPESTYSIANDTGLLLHTH